MKRLSLGRFSKYFFAFASLCLIFQAGAACPADAAEIVYDDFSGGAINEGFWQINDPGGVLTQSVGYLQVAGPQSGVFACLQSNAAWSDDFEIILQYSDFQTTATEFAMRVPRIALQITPSSGGGDFLQIHRNYNGEHGFTTNEKVNGTMQPGPSGASTGSASGQLKISRIGSTVTTYFTEGGDWVLLGTFANAFTGDVHVQVTAYTGDNGTFQVKVDKVLYLFPQNWGQITGKVTRDGTNDPIIGLWVTANAFSFNGGGGNAQTQPDGSYTITGLAPGTYRVQIDRRPEVFWVEEFYNNTWNWGEAFPVPVVANQTTPNIDFNLSPGSKISGYLKDEAGNPIGDMSVFVSSDLFGSGMNSQANGYYETPGMPPGFYQVTVWPRNDQYYVVEWYNNSPTRNDAAAVSVLVGEITENINFFLSGGAGGISGRVTDADGNPIPLIGVNVLDMSNVWISHMRTDNDGAYSISGMVPGQYKVQVFADGTARDYTAEYYDNVFFPSQAAPVTVVANQLTPNINFGLAPGGKITGVVTSSDATGEPVEGLYVSANNFNGDEGGGSAQTQADGTYTITGLASGTYRVQIDSRQPGVFWVEEFYNNTQNWDMAFPVPVVVGQTTPDIDFDLSQGGKISGYVMDADHNPIGNMEVIVSSDSWGKGTTTQSNGYYETPGLPVGSYKLNVRPGALPPYYISEWYDDSLTNNSAISVPVVSGQVIEGKNFVLSTGAGGISGLATGAAGNPVSNIDVSVFDMSDTWINNTRTGSNGAYAIFGLTPGQYKVRVNTSGSGTDYASEYYDNVLSSTQATAVSVTAGEITPNIDFALATGGRITGRVVMDGTPPAEAITGLWVTASAFSNNEWAGNSQTQADGTYTITGLATGSYRIQIDTRRPGIMWVEEFYNNTPNYGAASAVAVVAGQTTPDIDFSLSQGGKISGYVKDEAGNPIANMFVNVYSDSWGAGMSSQADGYYETPGLPPGSYKVSVAPQNSQMYIAEWYDNSPTSNDAASVPVLSGQVTQNIDFSLAPSSRIAGRVTRTSDGTPIQGIAITVADFAVHTILTQVCTGADGTYSLNIAPGAYRIAAGSNSGYGYQYYNNATLYTGAAPVTATAGQTTANIDFALTVIGTGGVISFAGTVKDEFYGLIDGATVEIVGANPPITTSTDASGAFNLPGLPAGNPFVLKFSKSGNLPTYSPVLRGAADMQGGTFYLYIDRGHVNALWNVEGTGAISGRVDNRTDNAQYVEGAIVRVTNASHPETTYTVWYCDGEEGDVSCRTDQGTYSNGRYLIPNASEDTVIVHAFKEGWSFDPRVFHIFTDGVETGRIHGIPSPSAITFAGYAKDNVNALLPGVAVQMVGNVAAAATDGTGSFNLAGLPNNAGFYMRYSKDGYIPVYTPVITSAVPISNSPAAAPVLYPNGQFPIASGKSAISGIVVNQATGATVGGVVVTLSSAKSPGGNAYVVRYCNDSGACSSSPAGTYGNGRFVVFDVEAGDVMVLRAEKQGWDFHERSLVAFADAITEMTVQSSMAITPLVENQHAADGNYYTNLDITIENAFIGALPEEISAITVNGPNGEVIATKDDFTYDPGFRSFTHRRTGQPALGVYYFTVTGNGATAVGGDLQTVNRNLPVLDKNAVTYTRGPSPTFSWPALDYNECPLYYRLVINDLAGNRVYGSTRVLGMLSHAVPAGTLQTGQSYRFELRVSDSSSGVQTQNISRSGWATFTVMEQQTISFAGTVREKNGAAVDGATVELFGANPPVAAATDAGGAFTLPGLPAGSPFVLRFSKPGYLPTYSAVLNSSTDLQGSTFNLFAARGDVNALWTTQGAVWGRVDNRTDNSQNVAGATVVATSAFSPGTTYPVYYCDDGGNCRSDQGTYGNGRFLIPNVPEDTVVVQAFREDWSFDPRIFHTFTDGVGTSRVHGISKASDITFSGYAGDNAGLPGVAVEMVGNGAVTATTDSAGAFSLAGLPNSAGFLLKYSKEGYIPVYTSIVFSAAPISLSPVLRAKLYLNGQFPIASGKSAITGIVVNQATGTPVGGAVVTVDSARSPGGNAYAVNYCTDAGVCSAAASRTYSNGTFVVFNVEAGDVVLVRAEKNGWVFYDRTLIAFADAVTETLVQSSMAITPGVEYIHQADSSYVTALDVIIENAFTGPLPDGIDAITVTGTGGGVIATKSDFTYSAEFRQFTFRGSGQPALGDYTFAVTGSGMTAVGTDVQTVNRNLPVPDKNTFVYTPGAVPTFSWAAVGYIDSPLYYRLIINNMAGNRVYASGRVKEMLSHAVPAGTLQMGDTYQFQVRVSDDSGFTSTQNSSRSGWVTFTLQDPGTVVINPEPSDMNATAPWTLAGPGSFSQTGMGDQTLTILSPGDYTVTWGDVNGWTKPSPAMETKSLTNGGAITFTGSYIQQPGTGKKCYNSTVEIPCPAPGEPFYGQDGNLNINPPSYNKLDANGTALPNSATTWATVKDNVTGLIWENKTDDGGIHDKDNTYTWCDTNPVTNGGNQGTCGDGAAPTDTEAFIKSLNDAHFGGFSDWRMPVIMELSSLANVDIPYPGPTIDGAWFPNTSPSEYWSSTAYAGDTGIAWLVSFYYGYASGGNRNLGHYVRAVRGGGSDRSALVNNGDGTITDTNTGLMWQKTTAPGTYTWQQALAYAETLDLAGHLDWRLPARNELQSLVDYTRHDPAVDPLLVSHTASSYYKSSTPSVGNVLYAWGVNFTDGSVNDAGNKSHSHHVRAVMGGQSQIYGHLIISVPGRAEKLNIGEQKTITWDTAEIAGNVKISLSRQGGKTGTFETVSDSTENDGSFDWSVTGPASVNCILKMEPLNDPYRATSRGLFTISDGTVAIKGDLNGDGAVDLADAILVFKVLSGTTLPAEAIRPWYAMSGADVNDDGKVGLSEALFILQSVAGVRDAP
jgi:protocatechuate 3,4-dioxygenase beta subunit